MKNNKMRETMSERLGAVSTKSFLFDLPDEELLQIIMPKEAASQLLAEYSSVYEAVMNTSVNELVNLRGMVVAAQALWPGSTKYPWP